MTTKQMGFFSSLSSYKRRDDKGDDTYKLYEYVHGRPGCVLERASDRVPYYCRLMGIGALSSELPLFDKLLCIIPCAAGVCHENRKHDACYGRSCQHAPERLCPEYDPDENRGRHGEHAGEYHLAERGLRAYVNAPFDIGAHALPAFEQAGYLPELSPYLLDHLHRSLAHARHRKRTYKNGYYRPDEHAYHDGRG